MATIDEIKARREKATAGPYGAVKYHGSVSIWVGEARPDAGFPLDTPLCTFHNRTPGSGAGDPQMVADATFLAAAHQDIETLLDEIARLQATVAEFERARDNFPARLAAAAHKASRRGSA